MADYALHLSCGIFQPPKVRSDFTDSATRDVSSKILLLLVVAFRIAVPQRVSESKCQPDYRIAWLVYRPRACVRHPRFVAMFQVGYFVKLHK